MERVRSFGPDGEQIGNEKNAQTPAKDARKDVHAVSEAEKRKEEDVLKSLSRQTWATLNGADGESVQQ
ncbi:hypothetical protein ZHAS_00013055 [Anopheles sinensis]|uniref:Uncharacterized protein n=1 Tax=Anopheles sinensis TaxID=74873 RepID=A0A084W4S6_ANOSI|nr:hypothetical protein ZHAS_00013055 [Anopheles sinensis]